ncbi:glycerate kinase [Guptibacillus hwajinpoensis]|uniref:glycerate kinase n=1 Tax=Guptibacillus hwajinpoensis TaxID=208199 RepID=UPI0035158FD6
MKRGIDVVLEQIRFSDALIDSDLVLTGEGQVDEQTTSGKTPMGVAQTAFVKGVPTIIIAGSLGAGIEDLYKFGVVSINSIVNKPMTLNEAVEDVKELLEASTEQIVRSFFYKQLTELKCT